jgi:glutamate-1-semialdehyde 2,1-aminomutase
MAGLTEAAARAGRSLHGNKVTGVVQIALSDRPITSLDDYLRADWAEYDRLAVQLRRRGVFVLPGGRWYLSSAHTEDDIATTVAAFGEALGT